MSNRGNNLLQAMFEDLRDDPELLDNIPTDMLDDIQHMLWVELAERERVLDGFSSIMDELDNEKD